MAVISSPILFGTICHDLLNWSFSQPHCCANGAPLANRWRQQSSISCVALHLKRNRFVEPAYLPAVERAEAVAVRVERHHHHRELVAAGVMPPERRADDLVSGLVGRAWSGRAGRRWRFGVVGAQMAQVGQRLLDRVDKGL